MSTPAYRTVTVDITQDDIDTGSPSEGHACPAAFALNRLIKPRLYAEVLPRRVILRDRFEESDEALAEAESPSELRNFVHEFDLYGDTGMPPLSFSITLPEDVLRPLA
jgi:hypothetical protein